MLLQENTDSAEEHVMAADVPLIGSGRGVDGCQEDVVTPGEQLRREGVVPQAASAIHRTRAARE